MKLITKCLCIVLFLTKFSLYSQTPANYQTSVSFKTSDVTLQKLYDSAKQKAKLNIFGQSAWEKIESSAIGKDVKYHFQPEGTYFGDPIPFYHNGIHHVFYLEPYKNTDGKQNGFAWAHIASRDLVTWKQLPYAIVPDEQEAFIATGSIVEKNGVFYAFYCTQSKKNNDRWTCMAISNDLIKFVKSPKNPLISLYNDVPKDIYNTKSVWRDPHVFWNPQANQWWMAMAAEEQTNSSYTPAGAIAYATSSDLLNWKVERKPMLLDRDCPAGECPDIFPFGDDWVMIYYPNLTRIRLAKSPDGPWRRPKNENPSGLHFNAGKTAFDGKRYIWYAYLESLSSDYDKHKYGGAMALPREFYLDTAGNPAVRLIPEIINACNKDLTNDLGAKVFTPISTSAIETGKTSLILKANDGENSIAIWKDAPSDFFFSADVRIEEDGLLTLHFRSTPLVDDSYILRIDPLNSEVSFHHWQEWNRMSPMNVQYLKIPTKHSFKLYIMLDGDVFEAFIDDKIAMSTRVQISKGAFVISSRDGNTSLKNLKINQF